MIDTLFSNPLLFAIGLVVILASIGFHEFAHAWAGHLQGDDTAKNMGRLTLNPAAHVDPFGLVALVLIGFGWGKPVPFNPYNLRNQKWGPTYIAVAGPLANVVLFTLSGLALKTILSVTTLTGDNALVAFLILMIQWNALLFFFNLIPIPPLDGSKFLLSSLDHPKHAKTRWMLETRGPMILLMLILADSFLFGHLIFGTVFGTLTGFIFSLFGL